MAKKSNKLNKSNKKYKGVTGFGLQAKPPFVSGYSPQGFPNLGVKKIPEPGSNTYFTQGAPYGTITSGDASYAPGTFDLNTPFTQYASEHDADAFTPGVQQGPVTKERAQELGYKPEEKKKKNSPFDNIKRNEAITLGLFGVDAFLRRNEAIADNYNYQKRLRNVFTQKPIYDYNYLYGPDSSGGTQYQSLIGQKGMIMAKDGAQIRRTASPNFGDVEVEGGEFIQLPDFTTQHVQGPSHAQGGVHTSLPEGSRVFSDYLKPLGSKKTYAQLAKKYDTSEEQKILDNPFANDIDHRTARLTMKRKQSTLNELFADQQIQNGNSDGTDQAAEEMGMYPQMSPEMMAQMNQEIIGKFGLDLKEGEKLSFTNPFEYGGQYVGGIAEFEDGGMFPEDSTFYGATPGDPSNLTIGTEKIGKAGFQIGGNKRELNDILFGDPEYGKQQVEQEAENKLKQIENAAINQGAPSTTNTEATNGWNWGQDYGLNLSTGFPQTTPPVNEDAIFETEDAGDPVTDPTLPEQQFLTKLSYDKWLEDQDRSLSNPKLQKLYKEYIASIDRQIEAIKFDDYSSLNMDELNNIGEYGPADIATNVLNYALKKYNRSGEFDVFDAIGYNKNISGNDISTFVKKIIDKFGKNTYVATYLGRDNTPVDLLEYFATSSDVSNRSAIARNKNTPQNVLRELSKDSDSWLVYRVLQNPNTPLDIIKKHAEDKSALKRMAIAENPKTPQYILKSFLEDPNVNEDDATFYDIKIAVANNPNSSVALLKTLKNDQEFLNKFKDYNETRYNEFLKRLEENSISTATPTATTGTTAQPGDENYGIKQVEKIKSTFSRDPKYKFRVEDLPQIKEELKVALKEWGIDTKENLADVDKVSTLNGFTSLAEKLQNKIYESDPEMTVDYGINEAPTLQGLQYLAKFTDDELNTITGGNTALKTKIKSARYGSRYNFSEDEIKSISAGIRKLPEDKQKDYGKTNFMDKAWFYRRPIVKEVPFKNKEEYEEYRKKATIGGKYVPETTGLYIKPVYQEDVPAKKEKEEVPATIPPGNEYNVPEQQKQMPSSPGEFPLYQAIPEALGYLSGLNPYTYFTPDYTHTEIVPPTLNIDDEIQSINNTTQSAIRQTTGNASIDNSRNAALFNTALQAKQQAFARKQNFDAQARFQADQYNAQARDLENFRDVTSAAQVYNEYRAAALDAAERERLNAITNVVQKKAKHDADEFTKMLYFTTMYPNYYYEGRDRRQPIKFNPYAGKSFESKTVGSQTLLNKANPYTYVTPTPVNVTQSNYIASPTGVTQPISNVPATLEGFTQTPSSFAGYAPEFNQVTIPEFNTPYGMNVGQGMVVDPNQPIINLNRGNAPAPMGIPVDPRTLYVPGGSPFDESFMYNMNLGPQDEDYINLGI